VNIPTTRNRQLRTWCQRRGVYHREPASEALPSQHRLLPVRTVHQPSLCAGQSACSVVRRPLVRGLTVQSVSDHGERFTLCRRPSATGIRPGFPIWTDCRPVTASTEPPVPPSGSSSTRPRTSTAVILATRGECAPTVPGVGHSPAVAFRDTPAGSPLTRHRLHPAGLAITSGATRAAGCIGESAERGGPSSGFRPAGARSTAHAGSATRLS